jgi:hypothetical protein
MALTLYNREKALAFAKEYLEKEGTHQLSTTPLALMPPPNKPIMRLANKARPAKMAESRTKRTTSDPKKRALSSGSPSHSSFWSDKPSFPYTVVGKDLPNGGRGKGLMDKKGHPLSFFGNLKFVGQPEGFFGDEEEPKPEKPPTIKINKCIKNLSSRPRFLDGRLAEGYTAELHLGEEISSLHTSFYKNLEGVAKAAGVVDALAFSR